MKCLRKLNSNDRFIKNMIVTVNLFWLLILIIEKLSNIYLDKKIKRYYSIL
jgi:hypothetical protein